MRFGWRNLRDGRREHRCALSAFIAALLAVWLAGPASAQMRTRNKKDKGKGAAADAPAAEAKPPGPPLTKTQAVFSLVQALALNQSDAALKTLEAIVEAKITFGGHNQQAAEMALVALTMRQSPAADVYLVKLISTPDETLRAADKAYSGAAVRIDAVRVIARVGSPDLRAKVAKLHDAATPDIRSAIETALIKPSPASFAAQVVLMRSHALPDVLRYDLQKQVLEQNAAALKQALRLTAEAPAPNPQAAAAALMAEMGKIAGAGGGPPGSNPIASLQGQTAIAPAGPATAGAPARAVAAEALNNPVALILEFTEKLLNATPADPALVARDLWQSEFIEALGAELARPGSNTEQVLTAVGSIPLKSAREHLRTYLLEKAPHEMGKPDNPASHMAAGAGAPQGGTGAPYGGMGGGMRPGGSGGMAPGGMGRGGMGGGGMRGGAGGANAAAMPGTMFVVGPEWLDPGALIALKSLVYRDRPKTRHHTPSTPPGGHRSAAAEKKAEEAAEKQRQTDMQYEWRDTIERFVTHWDERLAAVAQAGGDDAAADAKEGDAKDDKDANKKADKKSGTTKAGKADDAAAKKSSRTADAKGQGHEKGKGGSSAPTPSVPVPFVLRPGEHIIKEFHLRWPEDLPPTLTAAVREPLVVHYIQLEGTDEISRTANFYHSAMAKGTRTQMHASTHDIGEEKWVDIVQHDLATQRTRSLDVIVTRQPSTGSDSKRTKVGDLTIQVLMVEVETFVPVKGAEKEEAKEAKNESP